MKNHSHENLDRPEKLKVGLNEVLKKGKIEDKSFINFIREYIKSSGKKRATVQQYQLTLNRLEEFKSGYKKNIDFETIDLDFYEAFTKFLNEVKGYKLNTVGGTIKNIKVFMNEALERGLTTNVQFKSRKFKKIQEATENIYLSKEEINKLYQLDL